MPRQDSEPPMVVASRWVHQITTIALEMALPAGVGFWLDRRLGNLAVADGAWCLFRTLCGGDEFCSAGQTTDAATQEASFKFV